MTAAAAVMTAGDHQGGGERGRAPWQDREPGGKRDIGGGRREEGEWRAGSGAKGWQG